MKYLHPGSLGDIIYSMPFMLSNEGVFEPEELPNADIHLLLDTTGYGNARYDVLPSVTSMAAFLNTQPCIKSVNAQRSFNSDEKRTCINLGAFRDGRVQIGRGDCMLRYRYLKRMPMYYNLEAPWLEVPKEDKYNHLQNKIVVFRSHRYRNRRMSYAPLKPYADIMVFIGFENEYQDFCTKTGIKPQFQPITGITQAAAMLRNAAFVVGNQTCFFALAEGMKAPRILEMSSDMPDVIPKGDWSFDAVDDNDLSNCLKLCVAKFLH
jgi:hypothetical protein